MVARAGLVSAEHRRVEREATELERPADDGQRLVRILSLVMLPRHGRRRVARPMHEDGRTDRRAPLPAPERHVIADVHGEKRLMEQLVRVLAIVEAFALLADLVPTVVRE